MEEATLRMGGLPLMGASPPWPGCPLCDRPMLFRVQLPLAVSGLVGFDDDRVVLLFECHAWRHGEECTQSEVLVARGGLSPRDPPRRATSDGPPVMPARGGVLVPFDDDLPGVPRTTLPPLESLAGGSDAGRLLGLLGGTTPGSRDPSTLCACGSPTRTVIRLLATDDPEQSAGVFLGPTMVQLCLQCDAGRAHRMTVPRA